MTAPTPAELKTAIAGVFDRVSETYDHVGVDYFTVFGRRLVELAALRPGERVLDVGCGRGAVTFAAADAVGPEGSVLGIDLAPGMVQRTAADAAERGLDHVTVRLGDAEAPDAPEGSFDAVLAGLVVFFLPDPLAALRNYRALLADGGRLALTTFPPQPDTGWGRVGKAIQRWLPGGGVTARPDEGPLSTPERLADALREAGFAGVETRTDPYDVLFRDLDHWWSWAWSQGQRGALERIPADELDAFRAECYDLLRDEVADDGSVRLRQYVTYTVATA